MEEALLALLRLRGDERVEAHAPALLHALEAEAHVHGELEPELVVRLEDVQPAHDRTLVVRGPTTEHLASVLVKDQLERVGVPAIADVCLREALS